MAEIEARTLELSGGTDQGEMLVVRAGGSPVFSVSSDGAVALTEATFGPVSEPIPDVPVEESADAADNAEAINAILEVLRAVGLVPPTPED